ncbi:hypothetical protein BDF19DRAFT_69623 [Syncephalis fuscata]|nr:hypothetical protein BDF19DRAFT_69623 [Syncephalis fuscata]
MIYYSLTESTEDFMSTWNFSTIRRELPTSSTVRGNDMNMRPASFSSESVVLSTSQNGYHLPSDISETDTIRYRHSMLAKSTIRLTDLQATTDKNGNMTLEATEYPDGTVRRIPLARASMVFHPMKPKMPIWLEKSWLFPYYCQHWRRLKSQAAKMPNKQCSKWNKACLNLNVHIPNCCLP